MTALTAIQLKRRRQAAATQVDCFFLQNDYVRLDFLEGKVSGVLEPATLFLETDATVARSG